MTKGGATWRKELGISQSTLGRVPGGIGLQSEAPVANFFLRISAKILSISENF